MNLEQILKENYTKWQNRDYVFEKKNDVYEAVTYGAFLDRTKRFAAYLLGKNYAGSAIMLYGANCINYMVADLAVLYYTGISVGVSKEWKYDDLSRTIAMLDIPCVLYGEEKADVIAELKENYPAIDFIGFHEVEKLAETITLEEAEKLCIPQAEDICCKIVFSSGTTSKPKAAMLSRRNIFAGLPSLLRRCPFTENDVDYLFLPLNHTYAGIYNFLYSLVTGFKVYLCSSINDMSKEILEVQPTIFCTVPLICKKFYEGYGEHIGKAFGPNIQYIFCGGAKLETEITEAYKRNGLHLMNAYALSETASTFAIQYPDDMDNEAVGTVAEEADVIIIDPDEKGVGEIAIKGDMVFLGYVNDEALTKTVFTEDGYFRTGDLGYLLPDAKNGGQKLYLTGRIKKILLGANGENIEPTHIEELICRENTNINKALIYMQENTLSCHIYLKEPEERDWDAFFDAINEQLPSYEKVRKYDVSVDSVEKRMKQ